MGNVRYVEEVTGSGKVPGQQASESATRTSRSIYSGDRGSGVALLSL